jgi:hypothetical protein
LNPVPAGILSANTFDVFRTRSHESQDVSVYAAIERLMEAGMAVGLDGDALVRMLDRGMNFEELLELIQSKMECLQKAA